MSTVRTVRLKRVLTQKNLTVLSDLTGEYPWTSIE